LTGSSENVLKAQGRYHSLGQVFYCSELLFQHRALLFRLKAIVIAQGCCLPSKKQTTFEIEAILNTQGD